MRRRERLLEDFNRSTQLPKTLKTHDIARLFQDAGMQTTDKEMMDLLKRIRRWTVWESRYPAPLEPDDYRRDDTLQVGPQYIVVHGFFSSDTNNVAELYRGFREIAVSLLGGLKKPASGAIHACSEPGVDCSDGKEDKRQVGGGIVIDG